MALMRPISTVNELQRIKMRDALTHTYLSGFVVVKQGHKLNDTIAQLATGPSEMKEGQMVPAIGCTIVAFQSEYRGKRGWMFYTVPSTAMVILDE